MRKPFCRVFPSYVATVMLVGLSLCGCASSSAPKAAPTMAIVIATPDAPPSAAQVASIHQVLLPQITKRGFSVAKDSLSADYVMHVRFTSDSANPAGGHLDFIGIERNQGRIARTREASATEANTAVLAELRQAIRDTEWSNAVSR